VGHIESTLDGNAIAGLLGDLFGREMTVARSACGGCGAVEDMGALAVYLQAAAAVVRCRHCDSVLVVAIRARETWRLGFGNLAWLDVPD
jgi:hypothetical protein